MKKIIIAIVLVMCSLVLEVTASDNKKIGQDNDKVFLTKKEISNVEFESKIVYDPNANPTNVVKGNAYVPKGIKFKVKLIQALNSKHWRKQQLVSIVAAEPIKIEGREVVAKGAEGTAVLLKSRKAAGLGRKGKVQLAAYDMVSTVGKMIPLTNGVYYKGKTDQGAGVIAVASLVGGLFIKGSNVELPEGFEFDAIVREDVDLGVTIDDWKKGEMPVFEKKEIDVKISK